MNPCDKCKKIKGVKTDKTERNDIMTRLIDADALDALIIFSGRMNGKVEFAKAVNERKGEKNVGWQPETQPKGKPLVEKTKGAETMQRLIDADALIHRLKTAIELGQRVDRSVGELKAVLNDLESMPTIDAEPVRHGKWIKSDEYDEFSGRLYRCSNCNTFVIGDMDNYCPYCGTRMDDHV